jgi:hypothetical protein
MLSNGTCSGSAPYFWEVWVHRFDPSRLKLVMHYACICNNVQLRKRVLWLKRRTSICRSRWFAYLFFKVEAHEIKLCPVSILLPLLVWKICSPLWPISWFVCVSSYINLPKCNWEELSTKPKMLWPALGEKFAHSYCVLYKLPLEHVHKFI